MRQSTEHSLFATVTPTIAIKQTFSLDINTFFFEIVPRRVTVKKVPDGTFNQEIMTLQLQKITALLVAFAFATATLFTGIYAHAESMDYDYDFEDIESLETEPFQSIDGKWEVEVEFEGGKEKTFYVYEIEDEEELIGEITDYLNDTYDMDIDDGDVDEILEIDEDGFEEDDEDEDDDEDDEKDHYDTSEIDSIEAEPYEDIKGKWEVYVEFEGGAEKEFYVYNVEDEDELVGKIADVLNDEYDADVDDEDVWDVIEFDDEEFDDYDEDEDDHEDDKYDDDDYEDEDEEDDHEEDELDESDIQELMQALLLIIITMLLSGEGSDLGINISDLL